MYEEDELTDKERKRQERIQQRRYNDVNKVMSIPEGRRVIWDILCSCGIYRSSYSENCNQMAMLEGRRQVGLELLTEIDSNHKELSIKMQREYLALKKQEEKGE